jgi:hypothetical protein
MSALGYKPTFAPQNGMSALPLKADIRTAKADVRYGPKADKTGAISQFGLLAHPIFNHRALTFLE